MLWLLHTDASAGEPARYEPTRESLSRYNVPEWYHDAKIGFFYHWGPQSVVGRHWNADVMAFCRQQRRYEGSGSAKRNPPGQWGANMYPSPGRPDNEQNSTCLLHKRFFGDPKEAGYKDLIPLMSGDGFEYKRMVRLLVEAGARYIVPQAVHHDGFAMWDSRVIDEFNAARMGPRLDTTRLVIEEARRHGIKVGVSTHVARHSWYYNRATGYDSADPRYVQLYGEGLAKGGMPRREAIRKWEDTLAELVDLFRPDYIFVDGGTADTYCRNGSYVIQDAFRRIVARYYNAGTKHRFEPVISFKRESLWKEEAVPDYEGGMLVGIAPYKWQTHCNTAGWFYRPGGFVTPSRVIFRKTIDVVSKNGNMLLNLGLKGDGSMQEVEVAFLRDLAAWTKVVGEGIYATRPWRVYGEEDPRKPKMVVEQRRKGIVYDDPDRVPTGRLKLSDADIRYTRSKDHRTLYATRLGWPEAPFTLRSFAEDGVGRGVKVRAVSLLGSNGTTGWSRTGAGLTITPPATPVFDDPDWPVTFRLDVESTSR